MREPKFKRNQRVWLVGSGYAHARVIEQVLPRKFFGSQRYLLRTTTDKGHSWPEVELERNLVRRERVIETDD